MLENAYELRVPVSAGDRVRVSFEVVEQCAPSPQALDAVPALREGALQALPQATEESLPTGGRPQWSRRLEGGDGLELWAVAHCSEAGRICVLGIYDGRWTAQPCGSPSQIRRRGVWWTFPVAGRLGVAGLALEGTRRVEVVHDGKRVHELPLTGGVFGGLLPPAFGSSVDPGEGDASRRLEVRFRR